MPGTSSTGGGRAEKPERRLGSNLAARQAGSPQVGVPRKQAASPDPGVLVAAGTLERLRAPDAQPLLEMPPPSLR